MDPPRTSLVYNYFSTQENGDEKCNYCPTVLIFPTSANLKNQHPTEWADYEQTEAVHAELPV
jgi:hypothetical protein